MIGKTLAHYEIESSLGAGGMGEVYLARDRRLGRSVAVKVLPEVLAADPERIARFEREAKVLASLNHPNIAALYGLEEFEGRHFLVMELVEGDTLAERIAGAPLPPDETLKIVHQIVEALEAAHEKGIVHRDLKPANVKITPEGKVKVLDFGLAKAMENAPANATLSQSPTLSLSMAATNAGVILGTAAYMSPEQAKGFTVDNRSDIFSLGCVLYEMLAGRQAFQGDSLPEVLAGVLAREPDFAALPPRLHPRLTELLLRCLEKNPKKRWHAVADLRVEIEAVLEDPRGLRISDAVAAKRPLWKRAIPLVAAVVLSTAIAGLAAWHLKPNPPSPIARFSFSLPEGQQFTAATRQLVSISPDGTQFVYAANNRFYVKPLSELGAIQIQGTETDQGIMNPVFSPDSRSIAFYSPADGTLKKIFVSGGTAVTICPAETAFGISWGSDGQILVGQGPKGVLRVSEIGGKPETIISVRSGEVVYGPQMLPGKKDVVLFTVASGTDWNRAKIVVQSIGTDESGRKTLIEGGTDARYVPTGHIVYLLNGTLMAAPFDVQRLQITGGSVPVVEGVRGSTAFSTGAAHFSFSNTGSLVFVPGTSGSGQNQLVTLDRSAIVKPLGLPPAGYSTPRISPNGKELAFAMDDGKESNIFVYDRSGATSMRRLTFGGRNSDPIWAGDDRIVFASDREGDTAIFLQLANNTGLAERVTKPETGTGHYPESWDVLNEKLSFLVTKPLTDIWIRELRNKKDTALAVGPSSETNSAFSPDGGLVAYTSVDSGTREVFVQPFPLTGIKWQITRTYGAHPFWSRDGNELFYDVTGRLYSVKIHARPTFSFENPVALPPMNLVTSGRLRNWDITPDGKQFIGVIPAGQASTGTAATAQIQVVLNWFEELKQRMAAQ